MAFDSETNFELSSVLEFVVRVSGALERLNDLAHETLATSIGLEHESQVVDEFFIHFSVRSEISFVASHEVDSAKNLVSSDFAFDETESTEESSATTALLLACSSSVAVEALCKLLRCRRIEERRSSFGVVILDGVPEFNISLSHVWSLVEV